MYRIIIVFYPISNVAKDVRLIFAFLEVYSDRSVQHFIKVVEIPIVIKSKKVADVNTLFQ